MAETLAVNGASAVLFDREAVGLARVETALTDKGFREIACLSDVTDAALAQVALVCIVPQRAGQRITVVSMWGPAGAAALQPRPAYAASMCAVVNLTRELALDYVRAGIQVNAICPGFFRTETRPASPEQEAAFNAWTPMGRIAEAGEIAGTVLSLASSASDFVTGAVLVIEGGVLAG